MANNAKLPQASLLLTRPLAGSEAFYAALPSEIRAILPAVFSPLLRIVPLKPVLPELGSVIFTSQNGVASAPLGQGRRAYCVGEITTEKARDMGWDAIYAGKDAEPLIEAIKAAKESGPFVHLGGVHTRGDIATRLSAFGISTRHIALYDQNTMGLSSAARALLAQDTPVILPLFSPRSARCFLNEFNSLSDVKAAIYVCALSPAVAHEVQELPHAHLDICSEPSRAAMREAVRFSPCLKSLG